MEKVDLVKELIVIPIHGHRCMQLEACVTPGHFWLWNLVEVFADFATVRKDFISDLWTVATASNFDVHIRTKKSSMSDNMGSGMLSEGFETKQKASVTWRKFFQPCHGPFFPMS